MRTGYYDFVFTYEGKAIAALLTRFYAEGDLRAKSDADLEKLMHELPPFFIDEKRPPPVGGGLFLRRFN